VVPIDDGVTASFVPLDLGVFVSNQRVSCGVKTFLCSAFVFQNSVALKKSV
jgi:hypothetical protein